MTAIVLYRIDASKHIHRYYRMEIILDLFGEWCLMREWGRIGSHGQERFISFSSENEAQTALDKQRRAKERRGYAARPNRTLPGDGQCG